ncbi:MAG: VOC family protein [Clostridiaceae bacterium]
MEFTHICLVSENVRKLEKFYNELFQIGPRVNTENYIEFDLKGCILAIFDKSAHEKLAPNSIDSSRKGGVILEFKVEDVDSEYTRLCNLGAEFIKPPTTQPWGNRSIYFRDPDGNFLNFYSKI